VPIGHVERQQIDADGTIHVDQDPPTHAPAVAPVWNQGIPETTGLLATVRAASAGNPA
jgi:hypothetical protein